MLFLTFQLAYNQYKQYSSKKTRRLNVGNEDKEARVLPPCHQKEGQYKKVYEFYSLS